ncbi:unnamed protein product [Psylliodes chrysocephalus]|uniref:Uncharacterized protein n=1 Tax=Psylliodes chrysocephalus TaxID=3402493 RepID=A0A9P0CYQ9_9CUCU|nr:unnamed protein product [Psylliodes chrysocephala]
MYAMQLYNTAQYLERNMREKELVLYIARQFNQEMAKTIAVHNIKKMESLSSYLQRLERSVANNGSYRSQFHGNNFRHQSINFGNGNTGGGDGRYSGNQGYASHNSDNRQNGRRFDWENNNYYENENKWHQNRRDREQDRDRENWRQNRDYNNSNKGYRNDVRGRREDENIRQVNMKRPPQQKDSIAEKEKSLTEEPVAYFQ